MTVKNLNKSHKVRYRGEMVDISEVEPDPRTGKPQLKKPRKGGLKGSSKASSRKAGGAKGEKAAGTSTRKVYKVHKYKKSATSKAARSAQGKGRSRKKR